MSGVDTASAQRRRLRFNSVDELLAEMDRLVAAERAGRLRRTGNWTAGQIFGHLAAWIEYGYVGYPVRVPWFVRFLIRRKLPGYLRDGMAAGRRIPGAPGGTYGTDDAPIDEAAGRLRAALRRMDREEPKYHSPAFGPLSQQDRVALNLRHAELHLGFLHPE